MITVNNKIAWVKPMTQLQTFYCGNICRALKTAMLSFEGSCGRAREQAESWLGYCWFHLGEYKKAMQVYEALAQTESPPQHTLVNLACSYFFLALYPQAEKALEGAPASPLKTRLLLHMSHKLGDETSLMEHHKQLENLTEDVLCLAAVHYLRSHYQEAIDIYKTILIDNRDYLALNVYIALCYYKLDYYDISKEVIELYLSKYPDSVIAVNLKACTHYKLYSGKAAESLIKPFIEGGSVTVGRELINHNLVVFRGGEAALQVLPPLVDVITEARLNLVVHHFKQGEYSEAYNLIKNLEPSVPQEYILKGIVNVVIGQETASREHMKMAQQYFQLVGNSVSECDTIPGRQCMASAFFLQRQFDDVHIYLSTIKTYFFNDDAFNFNYAQAKTALGNYKEAVETLLNIKSDKYKNDYVYISHLARCYVMCGQAREAWELYLKTERAGESVSLLELIANDCYRMGHFYQATKAFDLLERLDPSPDHWEGKRGAAIATFQLVIAGKLPSELLADVVHLLRNSSNPQVESIIRIIKRWAREQRINI